jgi:hypothetical protein
LNCGRRWQQCVRAYFIASSLANFKSRILRIWIWTGARGGSSSRCDATSNRTGSAQRSSRGRPGEASVCRHHERSLSKP